MFLTSKVLTLAASVVGALSVVAFAQSPTQPRATRSGPETLTVHGFTDWVEKSEVSAQVEGVIKKMELKVGSPVEEGGTIGVLHDDRARLTAAKARVAAESQGTIAKGEAEKEFKLAELARLKLLNKRGAGFVSAAEIEKAEAEVKVAAASILEANENKKLAEAELAIAEQMLRDHTIRAPFTGIITARNLDPGEAVRPNEAVVQLVKIDTIKFYGEVPIEYSYKIKLGMPVDIQPEIEEADLPIEQKRFRGKITFVSPETVTVNKTVFQVYAEVQNNKDLELRAGLRAKMVVYLTLDPNQVPPPPADQLPEAPAARAVEASRAVPASNLDNTPANRVGLVR